MMHKIQILTFTGVFLTAATAAVLLSRSTGSCASLAGGASSEAPEPCNAPEPVTHEGMLEHLAGAAKCKEGLVIRLLSPRATLEECVSRCPPELQVVGGAEGARSVSHALDEIRDSVEALASMPGLDPSFARALRATLQTLRENADGRSRQPARALFVRGKPGIPADTARGVGLAISNLHDAFFDEKRPRVGRTGERLLINRIESRKGGKAEASILGGIVEIAGDEVEDPRAGAVEIDSLRNPTAVHFQRDGLFPLGIGMSVDGKMFLYGVGSRGIRRLPPDPRLRAALLAVLRRV